MFAWHAASAKLLYFTVTSPFTFSNRSVFASLRALYQLPAHEVPLELLHRPSETVYLTHRPQEFRLANPSTARASFVRHSIHRSFLLPEPPLLPLHTSFLSASPSSSPLRPKSPLPLGVSPHLSSQTKLTESRLFSTRLILSLQALLKSYPPSEVFASSTRHLWAFLEKTENILWELCYFPLH